MTKRIILVEINGCQECPYLYTKDLSNYRSYHSCNVIGKKGEIYCGYSSDEIKKDKDTLKDWFENQCIFQVNP